MPQPVATYDPARVAAASRLRLLVSTCLGVATVLGAAQAWAQRYVLNPDGNSYLAIAQAYFRGDFEHALNSYWSPLYSWLIGIPLAAFDATRERTFLVLHATNFAIFLGSLAAFSFFLRELVSHRRDVLDRRTGSTSWVVPEWTLVLAGYSLFTATALWFTPLGTSAPDLLAAGLLFVAAAILIRLTRRPGGRLSYAALGTTVGLMYLAKAGMLPASIALLLAAVVIVIRRPRRHAALPRIAIVTGTFLATAAPFVAAISAHVGYFTVNDAGRLNYAWFVNGTNRLEFWQGEVPEAGIPRHPPKLLLEDSEPVLIDYSRPSDVPYLLPTEASYWAEGVKVRVSVLESVARLKAIPRRWASFLGGPAVGAALLVLALAFVVLRYRQVVRATRPYWVVLVPVAVGPISYSLIIVTGRYVFGFAAVLLVTLLAAVTLRHSRVWERLATAGALAAAGVLAAVALLAAGKPAVSSAAKAIRGEPASAELAIARALWRSGIQPGDEVGSIGVRRPPGWPALAGVRHNPVDSEAMFWTLSPQKKAVELRMIRESGARAIVASRPRDGDVSSLPGARPVPDTGGKYYVVKLDR